jgi:hypothetical protein
MMIRRITRIELATRLLTTPTPETVTQPRTTTGVDYIVTPEEEHEI